MDFPLTDLMDEGACYERLVGWLYSGGLACPRCAECEHRAVRRRHRDPVLDYRCLSCRRVFNAFTGTHDGEGVREMHDDTQEGLWAGLRPFRGVNKADLYPYVAIFGWGYNIKRLLPWFIRALLGVPDTTDIPP